LVGFALKGALFKGDSVEVLEEDPRLQLSAVKDVDLPGRYGGALVDVLCAQVGHWFGRQFDNTSHECGKYVCAAGGLRH
jgi:hypothetical protein